MSGHLLQSRHREILDSAVLMQLQTLLQHPKQEAVWDSFHLLDCVHFHATSLSPSTSQAIHAVRPSSLSHLPFPSSPASDLDTMDLDSVLARGEEIRPSHTVVPARPPPIPHH